MGPQRNAFNAHREFGMPYLIKFVSHDFEIKTFAFVDDKCVPRKDVELNQDNINNSLVVIMEYMEYYI
jgi:hypothetical protein